MFATTTRRPRRREPLTIILGAGASLHAGAPSTDDLTEVVTQFGQRADQAGQLCRQIIARLKSSFQQVNFELVISALEELEPIAAAYMRPDVADEFKPVVASFLLPNSPNVVFNSELLSEARNRLLYEIADLCRARTYGSDVGLLKEFLDVVGADFSVRIFTLNYDDLVDRAVEFTDGYSVRHVPTGRIHWGHPVWCFDAEEFARVRRTGKAFLAHLHGSIRFGYEIECRGVVKWDRAIDAVASLSTSRTGRLADHGSILTAGPIISGFNKVAKLAGNPEPYAHYYAAFTDALLESNRVLVIGYGGMDSYVNTWLREFARAHGDRRRIAWVTHIPGKDVNAGRPDVKLLRDLAGKNGFRDGNAYDEGDSFQVQGTIALDCSGFPVRQDRLESILQHLAS